jgi:hypothetical protein
MKSEGLLNLIMRHKKTPAFPGFWTGGAAGPPVLGVRPRISPWSSWVLGRTHEKLVG